MDRHRQSGMQAHGAVCQIAVMQRGILGFRGFAASHLAGDLGACQGAVHAQLPGRPGGDKAARNPTALPSITSSNQNATLDQLNKILQASQLSPTDRTFYLSIRAFLLNRLGREAKPSQRTSSKWARSHRRPGRSCCEYDAGPRRRQRSCRSSAHARLPSRAKAQRPLAAGCPGTSADADRRLFQRHPRCSMCVSRLQRAGRSPPRGILSRARPFQSQ